MRIEKTDTFIEHDILVDDTKIGTVELCPERHEISRLIIFEPYQNKGYGTQVVQENEILTLLQKVLDLIEHL